MDDCSWLFFPGDAQVEGALGSTDAQYDFTEVGALSFDLASASLEEDSLLSDFPGLAWLTTTVSQPTSQCNRFTELPDDNVLDENQLMTPVTENNERNQEIPPTTTSFVPITTFRRAEDLMPPAEQKKRRYHHTLLL